MSSIKSETPSIIEIVHPVSVGILWPKSMSVSIVLKVFEDEDIDKSNIIVTDVLDERG